VVAAVEQQQPHRPLEVLAAVGLVVTWVEPVLLEL
jgi:hypothetical protein